MTGIFGLIKSFFVSDKKMQIPDAASTKKLQVPDGSSGIKGKRGVNNAKPKNK